ERALQEIVVIRGHDELLRCPPLAKKSREAREEAVKRAWRVVRVEDRVEIPVELTLAEDCIDVLRDAKQVRLGVVRIAAPVGERLCKLGSTRKKASRLPACVVRAIAEICAGAEERHNLGVREEARDQPVVPVICGGRGKPLSVFNPTLWSTKCRETPQWSAI